MRWLLLLFIGLPLLELALLFRIGGAIGFWPTLAITIAGGVLGSALAKHQGARVFREWQRALAAGRVPEEGLMSGLLVLVGAALLVMPGVLSDVIGLAFLLPPSRRVLAAGMRRELQRRIAKGQVQVFASAQPSPGFDMPTGPIIDVQTDEGPSPLSSSGEGPRRV